MPDEPIKTPTPDEPDLDMPDVPDDVDMPELVDIDILKGSEGKITLK